MRIYVGNLNYKATEQELRELFLSYGSVGEVLILKDRETQKPRGSGFVEMSVQLDAEFAIGQLNGAEFMGRELVVNEARPKENRGARKDNRYRHNESHQR